MRRAELRCVRLLSSVGSQKRGLVILAVSDGDGGAE